MLELVGLERIGLVGDLVFWDVFWLCIIIHLVSKSVVVSGVKGFRV